MKIISNPLSAYDLLVQDNGKLNVENGYLVFSSPEGKKTLEHYLYGSCQLGAGASPRNRAPSVRFH